jgi:hypothetical protein
MNAPVIGAQGSPYLEPDHWQFDFGYRYQYSQRHFTGTHEDKYREDNNTQVKNLVHLFNFGLTYGWTDRTSVSFTLPYSIAERSVPNVTRNAQGDIVPASPFFRNTTSARGIGDLNIVARRWMLDVEKNTDQNIGLGLGMKIPTGQPNAQDTQLVNTAQAGQPATYQTQTRTVDQSIQPGDGGWGVLLDLSAFKQIGIFTPYATGSYLINPQGTNGVRLSSSTINPAPAVNEGNIMSVPDQYLARIGTMVAITPLEGCSFGLGMRIEGIPPHDLIGSDVGFRRPGFAMSVEPSLVYASGKDVFSLAVPWAVVRNRQRSETDQQTGTHGDAAFADYLILITWSRRF